MVNSFVIHKVNLNFERTTIVLPKGTKILSVANQENHPVLWYERPSVAADREERNIIGQITGSDFCPPDGCDYLFVGTVQLQTRGRNFVLHFFEEVKRGK